jgi:hypothetical protein
MRGDADAKVNTEPAYLKDGEGRQATAALNAFGRELHVPVMGTTIANLAYRRSCSALVH